MEEKKVFRSIDDYMIAGVCSGLAKYFKIDSSLVRIIFVLLALSGGSGILIYLILWLVIPKENDMEKKINKKEKIKEFAGEIKDKATSMAKEIKIETRVKRGRRGSILGILLILVGLVTIWNQISPIKIDWNLFWPALLVLLGIVLVSRR